MEPRLVVVFSVVIALLPFAAIAGDQKDYDLKWTREGYFEIVFDEELEELVCRPPGGFEPLNVSHLGLSQAAWKFRMEAPPEGEPFGWVTFTGANGRDSLQGVCDGMAGGPSEFHIEWDFTSGTGRFEGATGRGHAELIVGWVDFTTRYEGSATITVPKGWNAAKPALPATKPSTWGQIKTQF